MGLVDADDRVGIALSEVIEQAITRRVIDNEGFCLFWARYVPRWDRYILNGTQAFSQNLKGRPQQRNDSPPPFFIRRGDL